jgi:hypothetical protein
MTFATMSLLGLDFYAVTLIRWFRLGDVGIGASPTIHTAPRFEGTALTAIGLLAAPNRIGPQILAAVIAPFGFAQDKFLFLAHLFGLLNASWLTGSATRLPSSLSNMSRAWRLSPISFSALPYMNNVMADPRASWM